MKRALPIENKPGEKELSKRPEHDPQQALQLSAILDRRPSKAQKLTKEQSDKIFALQQRLERDVLAYHKRIVVSGVYTDDNYQYRHVKLPKELAVYLPDPTMNILLHEREWRRLGIKVSPGWEHYLIYSPEPNIILLRRTHKVALEVKQQQEEYMARREKEKEQKEAAERAKKGAPAPAPAPAPPQPSSSTSLDKNAPTSTTARTTKSKATSLAPERASIRRKTTSTTATADQQETNNQA